MPSNAKKSFFSGVLTLSLSTVLVKIIGLIYKIPMLSYLGSEGMGYFNSAYEIYALFCVISTAGLPVALSVMISGALAKGDGEEVRRVYRTAFSVFLWIGILGTAVMLLFARRFCLLMKSEQAYSCILSISPTVFFVCIASALRGYFQGFQRMLPTALSQILESVGKLVFGLLFARAALIRGCDTPTVAAFAGIGLTLGTAVSVLYLMIEKIRFRKVETGLFLSKAEKMPEKYREIRKTLARLAIPMTLGASLVSVTKLIDMTMILRRLQSIGFSDVAANEAYGSYTTLALSLFGLLPSLVNAVALPLVPLLSAAIAAGKKREQEQIVKTSYRLTAMLAIPAALGISAYARPILLLLFGKEPEAVATAAPLLSCLGISIFLSCMITATNSVLHAYRVVNRPILSMLVGALLKTATAYFLIGNAKIAMLGAPISSFFCNAAVVVLNLWFSARLCRVTDLRSVFGKPLLSSTLSIGASYLAYLLLTEKLGERVTVTLASLAFAGVLYLFLSCLFGIFHREDILALPMGEHICRILQKCRLLPSEKRMKDDLKTHQ